MFKTQDGVSAGVTGTEIVLSLIGFTLVYGVLAVVWVRLLCRLVRSGPGSGTDEHEEPPAPQPAEPVTDDRLVLTY